MQQNGQRLQTKYPVEIVEEAEFADLLISTAATQ